MSGRTPYLGPNRSQGARTPYLGDRHANTGRVPYLGPTPDTVTAAPPPHHGHGGFFGPLENAAHWTAEKAGLAAHDVKSIPGGMVQQVRDEYGALKQSVEHPWVSGTSDPNYVGNTAAGRKVAADVHGMKDALVSSVAHPLRDPFQTGLTLSMLLGGVGSVAGRGAAVGRAVSEGGSVADLARAAVHTPPVRPRFLTHGDTRVSLHASASPAVRAAQAVYDRALQHGLDTNPDGRLAAHAAKRIGGALAETGRYQQRMRDVPAQLLQAAAKRLAPTGGRLPGSGANRFQRVEQAALELTSVNTPPELAAAYHAAQAEKGVAPELNRAVARLYQTVHQHGLLTTNEHGDVIVNAAEHPKLAQADIHLAHVHGRGDEILAKYGVRTPEALQTAVDAPGRYRAGATYERPTPGKRGESPALDAAVRQRDALQRRFDQSYEKQRGRIVTTQRPLTVDEAHAELANLNKVHNAALDKIAGRLYGPIDRREVNYRTAQNRKAAQQAAGLTKSGKRSGASGYKAMKRPTVVEERRAHAAQAVEDMIAKNPSHPTAAAWAERANRIEQLQAALHPDIFEKVDPAALGTAEEAKFVPRSGKLSRVGGALSIANDRVQRLEQQAANRVTDTGVIGGETARPGRGHVSYRGSEPRAPKSPAAAASGPVVGEAKAPITSHANEGVNIAHGVVPNDVTGQAARHYHQIVRFVNTTEHRNAAIRTGSAVRRSNRDVLVRVPGVEHARIPDVVNQVLDKSKLTHDDVAGIDAALQAYKEELVPGIRNNFAADKAENIGTQAPEGHVWVDKNVLGDLAKPAAGPRGPIARRIDTVNSAITAATVYLKVGHVGTRALTNATTNIIQGSARPVEIGKSVNLWHDLSHEDRLRALAAAGQHGFQAMPHEGTNRVGRIATGGANWWAKHVDAPFRFNSIAYEARKAGFDTAEKFRGFLDDLENSHNLNAAHAAKVDWVAKRANREGIAYDRLSEFERRFLTRAIWFYPWLRGTAGFAANTIAEHPFKSAVLGNLGAQGRERQQQQLGDVPSYEGGLFELAPPNGQGRPLVADFSTFSPFATPADLLHAGTHPSELSHFFNPVLGATDNLIHGTNAFGGKSKSPVEDALRALVTPTPEAQIGTAFENQGRDQSRRMFQTSPLSALYRALIGPGTPRRLNTRAAHSAAARERAGR